MVFFTIFIGLVVVVTFYFAASTRERLENDIKASDLALARSLAQEIDLSMRNAIQSIRELGRYNAVTHSNPNEMEELFQTVINIRPDISSIYRLNSQGFILYHYPEGPVSIVGDDLSYQRYFQRARVTTRPLISSGHLSPITEQPVATAIMPIWDEFARFSGVVAMNIKLESLSLTLEKISREYAPEEEFLVVIVDSAGQYLAHPDEGNLLRPAPENQAKVVEAVLLGQAGNRITKDASGREFLYSFVPVTSAGWGVIVSRPTKAAFATPRAFYQGVLVILSGFVVVGLFFWYGLNRQAIRPLQHLVSYSDRIGQQQEQQGSPSETLDSLSKRTDQVGSLTRSLLRMEEAINARLNELTTLLQTSTSVLSTLDSSMVLKRILEQVEQLMKVEMSAIVGLDERQGLFRVQASHGFQPEYVRSLAIHHDDPQSVTSRAIRKGIPVQVSDTETDPNFAKPRARARAAGYRSILAIPLNTQHAPPSALLVFRPEPHVFSEQEITLLSNFANHAALAIENAALYARSDTRLQEQTRRLEALIQSLNDGLILGNLGGRVLYANRSIGEWTRLDLEKIIGSSINQVMERLIENAVDPDAAMTALYKAIEGHGEKAAEFSMRREDGERHLRVRVFQVTDSEGIPIGYGQIYRDITADYELDRLKSSLITTVSHELRTPLASIKGYTTTLLADDVVWDHKSQREFLTIISDETDRLSALVNDLLDLSRIEAGRLRVSRSQCDFRELVQRAASLAHPSPQGRLDVDIPPDLPFVFVDQRRIEVVMRNLIENAAKFSKAESPIRVQATIQNGELIVKVEDEGPGIPDEDGDRIFESFYRLENDMPLAHPGFGLGLSICQGFIKAHGGEIWVEPCTTGTCIAFSLPVSPKD